MAGLPIALPFKAKDRQELIMLKTNIGGYFFDGFLDMQHTQRVTVTTHPVQTGASITDHAYIEPAQLSMHIKMSDCMSGFDRLSENRFFSMGYTRSVGAYRLLLALQEQRIPIQVHTRLKTYKNMLITSVIAPDDIDTLFGLEVNVEMQQVLVVQEKYVKISKREQVTNGSSAGVVNAGEVNDSLLEMGRKFFSGLLQ